MERDRIWAHLEKIRSDVSIKSIQICDVNCLGEYEFDEIVSIMRDSARIEHLMLRFCGVDDSLLSRLLAGIADNSALNYLDLVGNRFTDAGIRSLSKTLAHNECVQQLDLSQNGIGDSGAAALSGMLKTNRRIEEIVLDKTNVGDLGAEEIARGALLCSNLKSLSFAECPISRRGVKALALLAAEREDLSISGVHGQNAATGKIRVKRFHERQRELRDGLGAER